MSLRSWLWRDRERVVPLGDLAPLIPVDERGTGPAPCCAHLEQRLREVDEARATYFAQACDLAEKLAEAEACIAELTAALDRDRPAPDREALAADLERSWRATALGIGDRHAAAWLAAADTAIDTCRGLREAGGRPAGEDESDPADTAKVGDDLGLAWLDAQGDPCCARHEGLLCTRADGHSGQHVATGAGDVFAVWPADAPAISGGESPGSGEAALDLASRLAVHSALMDAVAVRAPTGATSPDPAPGGLRWGTWAKAAGVLRSIALDIDTREPVGPMAAAYLRMMAEDLRTLHRPDQRPVIAAVLAAHDVLEDGTCRCGWLGERIYHAEHVAAQIVGTGAVAR